MLAPARPLGPEMSSPAIPAIGPTDMNPDPVVAAGFRKPYAEFPDDRALYHALSPYPQYDVVSNDASARTSNNYHAVMFKVQQRYNNGLSFLAHWTIAKQIGDTDWRPGAFGGNPRDQYNRSIDRLIDRFDTPQRLVFNYSYDLPFGPGKALLSNTGKVGKVLLNGWTIAGVHEYMSGFPASFTGGLSAAIPGGTTIRPNRVLGVPDVQAKRHRARHHIDRARHHGERADRSAQAIPGASIALNLEHEFRGRRQRIVPILHGQCSGMPCLALEAGP